MSVESIMIDAQPRETRLRRWVALARRYHWWALLSLAALGLLLAVSARLLLGPDVAATVVVQRDFVQSVVASGHVEAPHRVNIGTQITATVKRVPVSEGQVVAAGEVLVELESAEARATQAQAEIAVQQAQARLRQLREVQAPMAQAALRQAEVTLTTARTQWRRNADLFRQGFIGQAALDDSRKAVDLADAQLRSALTQFETVQPQGSDAAIAVAALAQARASAEAAGARLRYTTIGAPAAGTLIARDVEPGDVVQPGKALMVLSPTGATELVVQIDERNLRLIAPGQVAQASADAYPERRFAAVVSYVNPGVDAQRGSVEVKLRVDQVPAYLRQDMTVSVDIETARHPQALLVPTDAVHDADAAAPWVLKLDEGRARRQPVRLGLHGGGFTEVREGLRIGDRIVTAAKPDLRDGARVRVAASAAR